MSKLHLPVMWLFALFLTLNNTFFAQTAQYYGFQQSQGVYEELQNPTNIITATDVNLENTKYPITLPFSIPFNNETHTSMHVHSSGFVSFGVNAPSGTTPISNSVTTFNGAISALGAYITGRYNAAENIAATISYETIGTTPNRELVVQWKNFGYFSNFQSLINTYDLNFQIRLNENGEIKFVYDLSKVGSPTTFNAQIGLRGASNTDFHNRYAPGTATYNLASTTRGSSNTSIVFMYQDQLPTSGLTFMWTPPLPCVAPTTQPTDLSFTRDGIITTVDFTSSDADKYLVLRTPQGASFNQPQDGVTYAKGLGTINTTLNAHVSHNIETTNFVENSTNSGILGNTAYTYTVYAMSASCLNGPLYNLVAPLTENVVTCPAPINTINLTNVDAYSFGINWVPNNGNALPLSYILEVATDNQFTNQITGSPFTITTTDYTHSVSQLSPSTTYYYRIKASTSCGTSVVSSTKTVMTSCLPLTELDENFQGSPSLPVCWSSIVQNVSTSTVAVSGSGGVGGTNGVNLYANTNPSGATANLMLITPYLSNLNGAGYRLKFDARKGSEQDIKLMVGTLNNNTVGATFTPKGSEIELTTTFQTYYVYFNDYTGADAYIGFKRLGTSTYTNLFIDNVLWEAAPSCAEVSGLTATDLTTNSAKIAWSGAGTLYDVEFGPTGFTPTGNPSANLSSITSNYVIQGLSGATTYQFYVRQNCSATSEGFGAWAGPFTFTTLTPGHIGSQGGTLTSGSFPIQSNYKFNYSQEIYLASELQAVLEPGETLITKIRFKQVALGSNPERYNNWKVYLGNTELSTFATNTSWIPVNHDAPNFDGELTFAANTWFDINLSTPFEWDGTSNLLVTVHEIVDGFSNSSFASYNAAGANRGILYRDDNILPNLAALQSAYTVSSAIAQIQIVAEALTVVVDSVIVSVENNLEPEITSANGTLQLEVAVYPLTENQNVTWSVESGNTIVSVDANGLVTGLTNGTAVIRATSVEDNTKYDEISVTVNVVTNPTYCEPEASFAMNITHVEFADISQSSSSFSDDVYEDFTHVEGNVTIGQTYTINVTANNPDQYAYVFVDWNQDFVFDVSEMYELELNEDEEFVGLIEIPATALIGNTRMRVLNRMDESTDACENLVGGQAEDYTLIIAEAIIPTDYCDVTVEYDVEPITLVDFADLNNVTSAVPNATPTYEDFTSMTANVVKGETYTMTIKGNTVGNFEHDIRVFIDWNQDFVFDMNTEFYTASLLPSTGEDDEEVTISITIPSNALIGNTRMRITKDNWNVYEVGEFDACTDAYYGQVEDYTISISEPVEVVDVFITTQNNIAPQITVENGTLQLEATVTPAEVNQDVVWTVQSGQTVVSIDQNGLVTALTNGTATIRATSVEDNTKFDEIVVTVNYDETIVVEEVIVTVENNTTPEITTQNGTLQLVATVNPTEANQNVLWSIISGNTFVSVNQDGLVTALANGVATVRATSVEDNTKYDEIEITVNVNNVGLESLENELSIYPNPTTETISIDLNQQYRQVTVKIVDATGRETMSNNYSNTDFIQLNLSSFTTGVYQLIIQTENYLMTKKIHKQ